MEKLNIKMSNTGPESLRFSLERSVCTVFSLNSPRQLKHALRWEFD